MCQFHGFASLVFRASATSIAILVNSALIRNLKSGQHWFEEGFVNLRVNLNLQFDKAFICQVKPGPSQVVANTFRLFYTKLLFQATMAKF